MESSPNVSAYRDFERRLAEVREKYQGEDSTEEDALLDEADLLWWALTAEEEAHIRANKGPHFDNLVKWTDKGGTNMKPHT